MISKVNIGTIISGHLATLRNHGKSIEKRSNVISKGDLILFFAVPIIPAFIYFFYHSDNIENVRSVIISAFSIFAALLFSFLILSIDIIDKNKNKKVNIKQVSEDLFYNISYEIFLSIIIIMILSVNIIFDIKNKVLLDCISVYLSGNFFLTLLMILKRMHILLEEKNKN